MICSFLFVHVFGGVFFSLDEECMVCSSGSYFVVEFSELVIA